MAHDIKPETSKAVTRGFKRSQSGERGRILHIPTPDYSVIPPKVDCWGSSPVTCITEEVRDTKDKNKKKSFFSSIFSWFQ